MLPDKQVKVNFKKVVSVNPDEYYPTRKLKEEGFSRNQCSCGTYFWSSDSLRKTCGEPGCNNGFNFFDGAQCKNSFSYVEVWKQFAKHMSSRGYTPIDRYSVVARWRDDTDFVQASIYDFQPYVVNGEIDPPANPLVVPQFSLRFNDIDNVGITMSHNTGFVMIGQHAFMPHDLWDQEKYFKDLLDWFLLIIGIPKKELIIQEDAWAGGGNFGSCMEFFSKGVELANQVYMLFQQTPEGDKPLKLKVLDMGMGHERVAWFSQGKGTIYDATFPDVIQKLIKKTNVDYDYDFIKKYLPYGSLLNLDESDDMDVSWKLVSQKTGYDVSTLKQKLLPLSALYSVAEHSRSLLVAISDGALPSNVKGGYNLRVILRRALNFIDKYNWDVSLQEICEWHADSLTDLFPELKENLEHVKKILGVEKQKYLESKQRNHNIVKKLVAQGKPISVDKLIELYDSNGIDPEDVKKEASAFNLKIEVPENFYSLVNERHEREQSNVNVTKTNKDSLNIDLDLPATKALYFDHFDAVDFNAFVVKMFEQDSNKYVVLNQTGFYPTSGGQIHDVGTISESNVLDVLKHGSLIVHKVDKFSFKEKDKVKCNIDYDRRLQLAQHHTATHILTGSALRVLGNHVWQAGASKTMEKSRLDITHYEQLSDSEIKKIELLANSVVQENRPIHKSFMKRNVAEATYGVRIYQGGAVPGKELRIVNIKDFDVEACGGTHLDVTGDIGSIKILKTSKIQDGVIRIEFLAGNAATKHFEKEKYLLKEAGKILECDVYQVPGRAEELFSLWKQSKKEKVNFKLSSVAKYDGDLIIKTAEILKTQPEHIIKTLARFKEEILKKK